MQDGLHTRDISHTLGTSFDNASYLGTVLDVVPLLEAQVAQIRWRRSLGWFPVQAEAQLGEMIREITCNKQQVQMILLGLVGEPESYRRVGTAVGSWSPHWPVMHSTVSDRQPFVPTPTTSSVDLSKTKTPWP